MTQNKENGVMDLGVTNHPASTVVLVFFNSQLTPTHTLCFFWNILKQIL